MAALGAGGSLMALPLLVFAFGVAVAIVPERRASPPQPVPRLLEWGATPPHAGMAAWTGPIAMLIIVLAMYGFTTLGSELMLNLPLTAAGGTGH